ncbi:MAG: glycerol-3-phosphate 1-O-acyltransferase PlsY [Bacillota bacterium]|jgi:glycerol-3-phosphate acyltransferase PlsY|nr:glycerol-3-phosphate 1-O-acyltransferase PlsY [Bacillota bacterium]
MGKWLLMAAACYLIGGIPFGFIVARLRGVDITKYGSGATGATNVMRVIGPVPAVISGVLDLSKGISAALIGRALFGAQDILAPLVAGLFAMTGHNFSPYLGFRGGKGVSVGAGIVAMLMPRVVLAGLIVFVVVVSLTRYVSLGSMVCAVSTVAVALIYREPPLYTGFLVLASVYIVFQHRSNIRRLLSGKESKFGERVKVK